MVRIVQKPGAGGGPGAITIVGDPPIHATETAPGTWEISYADLQELTSFTKDVSAVQEEGVTVDDINFSWAYNRAPDPASQSIDQGIGAIAVNLRAYNLGPAAGITTDITWTLSAVGDDGNPSSLQTSINFVYPFYYGSGAPGLNGAQIGALTKKIAAQADQTLAFAPVVEVYYFAYPAAYPNLTRILDGNGFDITADWTLRNPVVIVGLDGSPQNYKVYEFNNLTSTAQNLTFDF